MDACFTELEMHPRSGMKHTSGCGGFYSPDKTKGVAERSSPSHSQMLPGSLLAQKTLFISQCIRSPQPAGKKAERGEEWMNYRGKKLKKD